MENQCKTRTAVAQPCIGDPGFIELPQRRYPCNLDTLIL